MKKLIWFFLCLVFHSYSQTPGNGVTDIDGNQYNSVIIGTQEWQKENLNVSKYSDGTIIPQVTDPTQWANLTTGAWCYYNNDASNNATYGKLYNWYAAAGIYDAASLNTPTLRKKLAPTGWHVPTDAEWTTLLTYLGGESVAGGKMKETGTAHWYSPNQNATNSSGFTGLPGGWRVNSNWFLEDGMRGFWWSLSEYFSGGVHLGGSAFSLYYYDGTVDHGGNIEKYGFSVRCLKDTPLSNTTFDPTDIKIYPNPVNRVLNVNIDNYLINQPYTIIDSLGRVVLNGKLNKVESTINVEQLAKGIYYLKISTINAAKFIKD